MSYHMPDDLSAAGRDPRAYADEWRPRHGVVRNVQGEWVLLSHRLVVQADPDYAGILLGEQTAKRALALAGLLGRRPDLRAAAPAKAAS